MKFITSFFDVYHFFSRLCFTQFSFLITSLQVQPFCVCILFMLNLFFISLLLLRKNSDLFVSMFSSLFNFIFNFLFPCYVKEKKKLVLKEKKCGQKIYLGHKKKHKSLDKCMVASKVQNLKNKVLENSMVAENGQNSSKTREANEENNNKTTM